MSKLFLQKVLVVFLFLFFTLNNAHYAYCSGFAIFTQGASSFGQGAATIAHSDDPSAIFFNPALINKLDGTQIQLGTTLLFPKRKFLSDFSGDAFKTKSDVFYPSTIFITHKFNDNISAGLGVFNPFGLGTEWPDDWEGRYITTNAEMQTYNINPAVSYQITPDIAIAGGVNFLFLDAKLENKINLPALYGFSQDGRQRFKGDGTGVGYNIGILIEPIKDVSIGFSYRSKIKVDIDGKVTHSLPEGDPFVLFPDTSGSTKITLPAQAHAGIFYKGLDPLMLEVALRWEGWSSYDRLKITLDQPVGGSTVSNVPKNWKDTYSVSIGGKYLLNEKISLLAGYLYSGNPVPDSTFEPSVPDANTHLFTLGTSIKQKSFKIDLAYGYQKLQDRNKNNSVGDPISGLPAFTVNGKYKSDLHMLGISLTYKF